MAANLKSIEAKPQDSANPSNPFIELSALEVSDYVEKKNGFTYLSWPYAVTEILKRDYNADWKIIRYDGNPYLKTECGYFVEVEVTYKGKPRQCLLPVLDHANKPIANPNSFQINTSIQRCLVKCCSLHGLGLYIYAGEDLPIGADGEKKVAPTVIISDYQAIDILVDVIKDCEDMPSLERIYKRLRDKFTTLKDKTALLKITAATKERKAELSKEPITA